MSNGSKFAPGGRVVITEKYRVISDQSYKMFGYYGHVAEVCPGAIPRPMVMVSLKGRINGQPIDHDYIDKTGDDPYPLYEDEIEHAD